MLPLLDDLLEERLLVLLVAALPSRLVGASLDHPVPGSTDLHPMLEITPVVDVVSP